MCGIAGIITRDKEKFNTSEHLLRMSEKLRHRGPDDEGFLLGNSTGLNFFSGKDTPENVRQNELHYTSAKRLTTNETGYSFGFCHRRLSILDLSPRGHQPMCDAKQKIYITYNGEIYNYIEIREDLKKLGYHFTTETDTEVIINSYLAWGKDCLARFNGMWSFVIYDSVKNEFFASRDRFGVKPFYYYIDDENFCFASEQKAIVGLPFVKISLNHQAVYDYLVNHEMEYEPEGFFKNVMELFPGKYLTYNISTHILREDSYYALDFNRSFTPFDQNQFVNAAETTIKLLFDAVKIRLRSDVKVGACLSGGIDSSVIAGLMQQIYFDKNSLEFFTACFPGTPVDESNWASQVVLNGGKWNTVTPTSEELWKDLDDLVYSQDVPIWSSSTYAQFRVMKLAKESGVKVVLDGQGGDELFAGYYPYYLSYWNELEINAGKTHLEYEMKNSIFGAHSGLYRKKEKLKSRLDKSPLFLLRKLKNKNLRYLNNDFQNKFYRPEIVSREYPTLNEHLQKEFCNTRLKLYLKCEDRCSMWHSVESRTPFADDINLIEKIFSLPSVYKIHSGKLKYLLRESARKYIPESIYNRADKMGYVTPHNTWLNELKSELTQVDFSGLEDFIDVKKINSRRNDIFHFKHQKEDFFPFKLILLAKWKKTFGM